MSQVQAFDREMLLQYLEKRGVHFYRDQDGDFLIAFGFHAELGCSFSVHLHAEGPGGQIFRALARTDRLIPPRSWSDAVALCNSWNMQKRWPKAYVRVDDPTAELPAEIVLEEQIDLSKGIHQELLEDYTDTFLARRDPLLEVLPVLLVASVWMSPSRAACVEESGSSIVATNGDSALRRQPVPGQRSSLCG